MVLPVNCEKVVRDYLGRLEGEFTTTRTKDGCYIATPFIRPDGEAVELVAERDVSGRMRLTDMGDSLGYLYINGLTLSRNLIADVRATCRQFGASLEGSELVVANGDASELGESFHALLQTVLSVTDLIQRRRPKSSVLFDGEVESLIIISGVTYDADYQVNGKRAKHSIRFHINSKRSMLIQPLTAATEGTAFSWAERWAYRFNDIREADHSWHCIAILDDRGERSGIWSDKALAPLSDYTLLWRERGQLSESLSAN